MLDCCQKINEDNLAAVSHAYVGFLNSKEPITTNDIYLMSVNIIKKPFLTNGVDSDQATIV